MAFEFLTQPTDTTVTEGGTWGCSAAVSGGIQGATGIINLPITSQLEACPTVGVIGSTIYVGTGYDQGNDGFVYSLSASTETPTQYINAGSAVAGCYGMDVIDGVLWSSFVDTSSPYVSIIYNGSTILTSVSGVSDIYGFVKFSNGNIMSWGKGGYSTTSYPWIGMYSGGSFTTKYSGAVVTNTSVASVVITGSTTAFGITATGAIIKTTDSGNTWSAVAQIGSSTVGNATISLYDGKLIASHTVNGWYQSVDGGTTWSTYANSPSIKGYRRTRLVDGILYVPSYNSNLVAYSEGGDVWRYLTVSEGARVYDIAIYNGKAYCGIGATTGQGKIATVLIPSYLLNLYKSPSTLINSTTNTTGLYSYSESAELTDSGDLYITATNAGTTITSDTFTVTVESSLEFTTQPQNLDLLVNDVLAITATVIGGDGNYHFVLITDNTTTIDEFDSTTGIFSYSKTAELTDAGSYRIDVTSEGVTISSVTITVLVTAALPITDPYYMIRYLVEIAVRTDFDPTLMVTTNIQSSAGIIAHFDTVERSNNYWTNWGGWYSAPKGVNAELFFGAWCNKVGTMQEMIEKTYTVYQSTTAVFVNLPLYVWQVLRSESYVSAMTGFSSCVPDISKPSDDHVSGVRYPVRLKIPTLGTTALPDPINGVLPTPAFSVRLENGDGYFDLYNVAQFFNTPLKIRKTTVEIPTLADYTPIRSGLVDSVEISQNEFSVKTFDSNRSFTAPVCRTITADEFPGAIDDVIGKSLPLGYGFLSRVELIKISDENSFRYVAVDPEYLVEIVQVWNEDGASVVFTVEDGVIEASEALAYADVQCLTPSGIADIIVAEIVRVAGISYVPGLWDVEEVERYRYVSPEISLFFKSGTLKQLIETVLKNDSAFVFTKNDGRLTIRRWGLRYDYHTISKWYTTQHPKKTYSSNDTFASSVLVNYYFDYKTNSPRYSYLYDSEEAEVFEIYSKKQRKIYDTTIVDRDEAADLAHRLFARFSKRVEIISLGTGYNCAQINVLDTVEYPIFDNDRRYSYNTKWVVRSVDAAQDQLELEEYRDVVSVAGGVMVQPSTNTESGEMVQVSDNTTYGILAQPTSAEG